MSDEQTGRDNCYICSRGNPDTIESHHIIPSRHGGSDNDPNRVEVCATCHQALEKIYDERFWARVGAMSKRRKMGVLVDDVDARLQQAQTRLYAEIGDIREELDTDYRESTYPEAEEIALNNVSVDHPQEDIEEDVNRLDSDDFRKEVKREVRRQCAGEDTLPGANIEKLKEDFVERGAAEGDVEVAIQKLRDLGEVYSPSQNFIRVV